MHHAAHRPGQRKKRRPSKNKIDTSVKVGSLTARLHMFKKNLYGSNTDDESSFLKDLDNFATTKTKLKSISQKVKEMTNRMIAFSVATHSFVTELEKLTVDSSSPNKGPLVDLCRADTEFMNSNIHSMESIVQHIDSFAEELELGIPSVENLLDDRRDKFGVYSLYKHKLDKACKAAKRAREKKSMLSWSFASASSLELEVVRKQGQFENTKKLFFTADAKLNAAIGALKSSQAVMVRSVAASFANARCTSNARSDKVMKAVLEALPSAKEASAAFRYSKSFARSSSVSLSGVFGVPLVQLALAAQNSSNSNSSPSNAEKRRGRLSIRAAAIGIPNVVGHCIAFVRTHGLEREGLFRVPGDMKLCAVLKARYNRGENVQLEVLAGKHGPQSLVNTACTLLKMFFRDLPLPLLPFEAYEPLLQIFRTKKNKDESKNDEIIKQVRSILLDKMIMPEAHQRLLSVLFQFLHDVKKHCDVNKMSSKNLAVCWAPSLLRPDFGIPEGTQVDPKALMALQTDAMPAISCIEFFLDNFHVIFSNEFQSFLSVAENKISLEEWEAEEGTLEEDDEEEEEVEDDEEGEELDEEEEEENLEQLQKRMTQKLALSNISEDDFVHFQKRMTMPRKNSSSNAAELALAEFDATDPYQNRDSQYSSSEEEDDQPPPKLSEFRSFKKKKRKPLPPVPKKKKKKAIQASEPQQLTKANSSGSVKDSPPPPVPKGRGYSRARAASRAKRDVRKSVRADPQLIQGLAMEGYGEYEAAEALSLLGNNVSKARTLLSSHREVEAKKKKKKKRRKKNKFDLQA
eukprot:g4516.t1